MEAPPYGQFSYPRQAGSPNVIPEPDIEHQWIQGVQDNERQSRKRNIALIWCGGSVVLCCAAICCFLLIVIAPIFVILWVTLNYD